MFCYLPAEIDELNSVKEVTQLCLFYVDLQGEILRLQASLVGWPCKMLDFEYRHGAFLTNVACRQLQKR